MKEETLILEMPRPNREIQGLAGGAGREAHVDGEINREILIYCPPRGIRMLPGEIVDESSLIRQGSPGTLVEHIRAALAMRDLSFVTE